VENPGEARAFSADLDLMREIFYLYILSKVGLHLNRRGLHRLHVAALVYRNTSVLLMCPSGSEKYTIVFNLLKRDGYSMMSEDSPLIGTDGSVYPFPLCLGCKGAQPGEVPTRFLRRVKRMEFEPKTLIDLSYFEGQIQSQVLKPGILLVGLRHSGPTSAIEPLTKSSLFQALLRDLVLAVGFFWVLSGTLL